MKKLLLMATMAISAFAFTGCSKDDDDNGTPSNNKNFKFTFKQTDMVAGDNMQVIITGSDLNGSAQTMFKVNGEVQSNQRSINIPSAKFLAGDVVVETTTPLYLLGMGISATNAGGTPFSIKVIPVLNGAAQAEINESVSATFSKNYNY